MHDLNGALLLMDSSLFVRLFALVSSIVIGHFKKIYAPL